MDSTSVCGESQGGNRICSVLAVFFTFFFAVIERRAEACVGFWCTSCRERNSNVRMRVGVAPLPPLDGFSKVMAGLYKQEGSYVPPS